MYSLFMVTVSEKINLKHVFCVSQANTRDEKWLHECIYCHDLVKASGHI